MVADRWAAWLSFAYQDLFPSESAEIMLGITHGVDIEFTGARDVNRRRQNHGSALKPGVREKVAAILFADVAAGKKAGPFDAPPFSFMSCSPLGAVEKKGKDAIRVIHDLSYPVGGDSINHSIVERGMTLGCFDLAADAVRRFGAGCFLIKLDVEAAYKQVPVRPEDWPLLGFTWDDKFYFDRTLPFGLTSSCRKWDLYATALHFFFQFHLNITVVIHYIDDFLFVVQSLEVASAQLDMALRLCRTLGMPMSPKKTEGPCTRLVFLGIELDTVTMRARLSDERLADLKSMLLVWVSRDTGSYKEITSLTGILNFACTVVRPGRTYMRRLIAFTTQLTAQHAPRTRQYPLSSDVHDDIAWWSHFVHQWNGISLLYELEWSSAVKLELFTDACLTGYGATFGVEWFQGHWSNVELAAAMRVDRESMPYLELMAVVLAAITWGHQWRGMKVLFHCDCQPVVQALKKMTSPSPDMMHLIRQLSMTAAIHGYNFRVDHIPGVLNVAADALSRYDSLMFQAACPLANSRPTPVGALPLPPLHQPL